MLNVQAPEWFKDTPCVGEDRLFFSARPSQRREAISMCEKMCNHREECLRFALENKLTIGVWGGHAGPDLARLLEGCELSEHV